MWRIWISAGSISGPVHVEGAEPGDALKITIDSFVPRAFEGKGFGWTANIPGFGLLADQFTDPALTLWSYDPQSLAPALWGKAARVPLKPFAGTIGNALAETGLHSIVPPRRSYAHRRMPIAGMKTRKSQGWNWKKVVRSA